MATMGMKASLQRQAAKEFSRALRRAQKAADCGKPELAIGWCRYAAALAWRVNPGFFYSHELEELLADIGRKYLGPAIVPASPAVPPRRFLHVMSTAYETGGHTRAVSRWIEICAEFAPSERHSILISMQKDDPLPAWLGRSAQKTGGDLTKLPPGSSWLQAAAEIRSRAMEYDAVILHIHPDDPLPDVALFDQLRPTLFFRHSDQTFNLGLDVGQVVADICPVGHEMTVHFCAQEPRKIMLPLPLLDDGLNDCRKVDARTKLGLPADAFIFLTIGWPLKFIPRAGYNFPAVVRALHGANSRAHVVAIGLTESDPFPGLKESMGGRFVPVGAVDNRELLELYYCATDIYLDAYPCGSSTAVLDAARHRVPVLRLRNPYRCLIWSDNCALDSVMLGASTQGEFIATALEWMDWPEEKRAELGARFREAVLRDHCGASWKSKWLDPAVNALISPCGELFDSRPNCPKSDALSFPGLGLAGPESGDWPAGMFIAGTILETDDVPRPVRISGALRSIRPALLGSAGDGMRRERIAMLGVLIASFMPNQVRTVMRWMWHGIIKKS